MINEIRPSPPVVPIRKKKLTTIKTSLKDIYVSELPTLERQNLCNLLNEQNKIWETLATEMKFTANDIRVYKLGFSIFSTVIYNILILGNSLEKTTDVHARSRSSAINMGRSNQSHSHRTFCSIGQVLRVLIFSLCFLI